MFCPHKFIASLKHMSVSLHFLITDRNQGFRHLHNMLSICSKVEKSAQTTIIFILVFTDNLCQTELCVFKKCVLSDFVYCCYNKIPVTRSSIQKRDLAQSFGGWKYKIWRPYLMDFLWGHWVALCMTETWKGKWQMQIKTWKERNKEKPEKQISFPSNLFLRLTRFCSWEVSSHDPVAFC